MSRISLTTFLFTCLCLASCDCYVAVKGVVISSTTGERLSGVRVEMLERNIEATTNHDGQFLLADQTGFCYDPDIRLTMSGFKPFRLKISRDSETESFQVNTESDFVHHDEPVESRIGMWIDIYSQDFRNNGDTIIFYLDEDNPEREIELNKKKLKTVPNNR